MRAIVGVAGASLLLRLTFVFLVPPPADIDAGEYDVLARSLLAGRGFEISPGVPSVGRAPLYPFVVAGVYAILGPERTVIQVFQALVGALVSVGSAVLAARVLGPAAALPAAAVSAVWPALVIYPALLLTETLASAVVLALALVIARDASELRWCHWLVVGVLGGMVALLRQEFLALPFAIVAVAAAVYRPGWRGAARWAAAGGLGVMLVVVPWTARNYAVSGVFIPVALGAGTGIWLAAHPHVTETPGNRRSDDAEFLALYHVHEHDDVALDRALMRAGLAEIVHRPVRYALGIGPRIADLWLSSHSYAIPPLSMRFRDAWRTGRVGVLAGKAGLAAVQVLLLGLAVVGFGIALFQGIARGPLVLALVPVIYGSVVYAAVFATARYQVPLLPVAAAGAGYGISLLRNRMGAR